MASSGEWCTIESDPGVFTSLVEDLGVRNVEFAELWSLDDDSILRLVHPVEGGSDASVHGLIFLFKWQGESSSALPVAGEDGEIGRGMPLTGDDLPKGLFFARQVTHNACATIGILSCLLNAPGSIVEEEEEDGATADDNCGRRLVLGRTLSSFKSFTSHFPPELKGEAVGSSEEIRAAHNSFGRAEDAFLSDPTKTRRVATEDDDVFHFVAYVPHPETESVYELDGLREGPVKVGSYKREGGDSNGIGGGAEGSGWICAARDAVRSRLARHPEGEIKFNLMAVVQDRRTCLASRIDTLAALGMEESDESMLAVRSEMRAEEEKRARWKAENERRRHNYLPFCVELLRQLVRSRKYEVLVDKARKTAGEKRKRAEEMRAKKG